MSNKFELFNIKLKRYITQYDYLESLLQETKILFEEYNQTFLSEYYDEQEQKLLTEKKELEKSQNPKFNAIDQNDENENNDKKDDNFDDNDDDDNNDDNNNFDLNILKKLYRRLSLKTHPDKIKGKGDFFKKINIAHKKKDLIALVRIAKELNIDISDIIIEKSDSVISTFDKNIQNIEKEIYDLKHTVAWHWAHASPEEKKLYKEKTRAN